MRIAKSAKPIFPVSVEADDDNPSFLQRCGWYKGAWTMILGKVFLIVQQRAQLYQLFLNSLPISIIYIHQLISNLWQLRPSCAHNNKNWVRLIPAVFLETPQKTEHEQPSDSLLAIILTLSNSNTAIFSTAFSFSNGISLKKCTWGLPLHVIQKPFDIRQGPQAFHAAINLLKEEARITRRTIKTTCNLVLFERLGSSNHFVWWDTMLTLQRNLY